MELIEVNGLRKTFLRDKKNKTEALKGVSFYVKKGETLGIVGESGSGKSTIARLITGLIPSTTGDILIDGENIIKAKKHPKDLYKKIQMIFQNPVGSFDPRKTLGYGIGESLRNRGINGNELSKKIEELLRICGLNGEFADKYPHQVSGGQCQRAAIARALAVEPEILICDEATSSLDVTVQKQIIELLDRLRKEQGLTIIFICHNLALVQMFCDRVIVLKDGMIVEEGIPDSIIKAPTNEYTKILVDSVL